MKIKAAEELKTIIKDMGADVCYFGEDGSMVIFSQRVDSEEGALRKFRMQTFDDAGQEEADSLEMEYISVGFLRLPTNDEIEEHGEDAGWIVSTQIPDNHVAYVEVWVYVV